MKKIILIKIIIISIIIYLKIKNLINIKKINLLIY